MRLNRTAFLLLFLLLVACYKSSGQGKSGSVTEPWVYIGNESANFDHLSPEMVKGLDSIIPTIRNLRHLSITNSQLNKLPFNPAGMALYSLDLSHNDFESFPAEILRLRQLYQLTLAYNKITHFEGPAKISELRIDLLSLAGNKGIILDSSILNLRVRHLDISECDIDSMPSFLMNANHLTISIGGNPVEMNDSIRWLFLNHGVELNPYRAYFYRSPLEFGPQSVRYLSIEESYFLCGFPDDSKNKMAEVFRKKNPFKILVRRNDSLSISLFWPNRFYPELEGLMLTNFGKCLAKPIDKKYQEKFFDLSELTTIKELWFEGDDSDFDLTVIPEEITRLRNLKTLIFSSTVALDSIPPSIGNMDSLENLMIGYDIYLLQESRIRGKYNSRPPNSRKIVQSITVSNSTGIKLPEEIGQLKRLKRLYIGGSGLKKLPTSLANLNNLESLFLIDTYQLDMAEAVEVILKIPNLKYLHLPHYYLTDEEKTKLKAKIPHCVF